MRPSQIPTARRSTSSARCPDAASRAVCRSGHGPRDEGAVGRRSRPWPPRRLDQPIWRATSATAAPFSSRSVMSCSWRSDHGAVSFAGSSDASAVASSTNERSRMHLTPRSVSGTRALRSSAAGTPSSRGSAPGRNRKPTNASRPRGFTNAVVSGPATTMRPAILMRSMQPSGKTRTGWGGPSTTHVRSTSSRRCGGGRKSW